MRGIYITNIVFKRALDRDQARGLLGWVTCDLGEALRLDGITVRKTLDGRLTLSFPAREDGRGQRHAYMRPIDSAARMAIEESVLAALPANLGEGLR